MSENKDHLLAKVQAENRRLRWWVSVRLSSDGERTLLDEYNEINPEWIDATMDGTNLPLPPFYKEIF